MGVLLSLISWATEGMRTSLLCRIGDPGRPCLYLFSSCAGCNDLSENHRRRSVNVQLTVLHGRDRWKDGRQFGVLPLAHGNFVQVGVSLSAGSRVPLVRKHSHTTAVDIPGQRLRPNFPSVCDAFRLRSFSPCWSSVTSRITVTTGLYS